MHYLISIIVAIFGSIFLTTLTLNKILSITIQRVISWAFLYCVVSSIHICNQTIVMTSKSCIYFCSKNLENPVLTGKTENFVKVGDPVLTSGTPYYLSVRNTLNGVFDLIDRWPRALGEKPPVQVKRRSISKYFNSFELFIS